jgi:hypothetical protein
MHFDAGHPHVTPQIDDELAVVRNVRHSLSSPLDFKVFYFKREPAPLTRKFWPVADPL